MNRALNTCLGFALPLVVASMASAQAYTYSQNFDNLPLTGTTNAIAGTGALAAQGDLTWLSSAGADWRAARITGSGTTVVNLVADAGTSNTGTIHSYGVASDTNRAIGCLPSGSNGPACGVALTNNTGQTLTTITIDYDAAQWRSPSDSSATAHGVVNTMTFSYGFSSAGILDSDFLSNSLMTVNADGNVDSDPPPVAPPYSTPVIGKVDKGHKTITLSNITWPAGERLYLKWMNPKVAGNCAGLAIDNLVVTADAGGGSCFGDLDQSGEVDAGDLGLLLLYFGPCEDGCGGADLDESGEVDSADLGLLLLSFGTC
jgi:hypothetical protein